ncbi:transcriptional regulator with XRE-family HTH domain [Streptomyces sp. PvR006]|uniref:helix-turn-helix domain-containing protein n=1 Tax=unclassified Streptomyces TaxID=2593676 RepID=UPI001AEB8E61|nr:helix-turn-helix transcriptional regulator [Streptomyces sp. PvR006]MBP2581778.1 transcriptional regulator with XRE-family HTH domain [Streptomyces sp. PvR006]
MVNIRSLDPSASPLDYYGYELRRLREEAGLSQSQLGDVLFCTGSLVGQIETARKVPTREFSERLDAALMTGGLFTRLVGLVLKSQLPSWFRPYADMEARATYLCSFQVQVVHGLLQTKGYARALMGARVESDLDGMVAARIERQRILDREHPPLFWVVMSEAALRQEVGGQQVMQEQLAHLLVMQEREWVKIQILPFEAGAHAGSHGSFNLLRFESDPDLVYTEDFVQGHMTVDSAAFREGSLRYDHLRAAALSVEDSTTLITRVMEEHYGDQPDPGGSALA